MHSWWLKSSLEVRIYKLGSRNYAIMVHSNNLQDGIKFNKIFFFFFYLDIYKINNKEWASDLFAFLWFYWIYEGGINLIIIYSFVIVQYYGNVQ